MGAFWSWTGGRAEMAATSVVPDDLERGISPGEVRIHLLRLEEEGGGTPSDLLAFLPRSERERYRKIGTREKRKEFLWSRLLLHGLLAHYLHRNMGRLKIVLGEGGKPFLPGSFLQFNLSHTPGLIACSFGWDRIGVDVEKGEDSSQARRRWDLIADHYFSTAQREYFVSRPERERSRVFLRTFTLKEAQGKMLGSGLSHFASGFILPPPSEKIFRSGTCEYFTSFVEDGEYHLANAVETFEEGPRRYSITQWTQGSLGGLFKDSIFGARALSKGWT